MDVSMCFGCNARLFGAGGSLNWIICNVTHRLFHHIIYED